MGVQPAALRKVWCGPNNVRSKYEGHSKKYAEFSRDKSASKKKRILAFWP